MKILYKDNVFRWHRIWSPRNSVFDIVIILKIAFISTLKINIDMKVNKLMVKCKLTSLYFKYSKYKENLANNTSAQKNPRGRPQRSKASPGRYCPLLLPVQHCCPRVKGADHLFDHFIKKQTGQMTVQEGFELKGNLQKR